MGSEQTCQALNVRGQVRIADSPFLARLTKVAIAVQGIWGKVIRCELNKAQAVERMDELLASRHSTPSIRIITASGTDSKVYPSTQREELPRLQEELNEFLADGERSEVGNFTCLAGRCFGIV